LSLNEPLFLRFTGSAPTSRLQSKQIFNLAPQTVSGNFLAVLLDLIGFGTMSQFLRVLRFY
jgi:hypothetical protein